MPDTPRSLPPRVSANERLPAGHPILFEECLVADSMRAAPERFSGALPTKAKKRRYWIMMGVLGLLALAVTAATLAWKSPVPISHPGFWAISQLRASTLLVIAVVAFAQATATIAFQTVTNNRILTPSIMGFESLYRACADRGGVLPRRRRHSRTDRHRAVLGPGGRHDRCGGSALRVAARRIRPGARLSLIHI